MTAERDDAWSRRTLLGALAASLAVVGPCAAPDADPPPVAAFRRRLRTFRTAFVVLTGPMPTGPQVGLVPSRPHRRVFRIDADRAVATLEDDLERWTWAGGHLTAGDRGWDPPGPVTDRGTLDAPVSAAWEWARAGMPGMAPRSAGPPPPIGAGSTRWRVPVPFPWAEGVRAYLDLSAEGSPTWLGVHGASAWIVEPHRVAVAWDVALLDDFDRRTWNPSRERWDRPYHLKDLPVPRRPWL